LLHQRFSELADEVAEREAFVSSMQQLGKLSTEHVNVVRSEAAAKVQEMRQLDEQIQLLDRRPKVDVQP
jgi:adenylate kinase